MDVRNKRIVILIDNLYQEMETWYPYFRFKEAGADCFMAGAESGKIYTSKHGYPAKAEKAFEHLSADAIDAVVVPGGYAPDLVRRNSWAVQFVREMDERGKLVASICHGLWVLCSANILRERRVTCFRSIKDDVINAGGLYEDREVVVDQNLVTSRMPDDLPAFCRESIRVLVETPVLAA